MSDVTGTEENGCASCARGHVEDLSNIDPPALEILQFLRALPNCKVEIKVMETVSPDPIQAFAPNVPASCPPERKVYLYKISCPITPARRMIAGMYQLQFDIAVSIPEWGKKTSTLVVPYLNEQTKQWAVYSAESIEANMDPTVYDIVWRVPYTWIPTLFPMLRDIIAQPDTYTLTDEDQEMIATYDNKRIEAARIANEKHWQQMKELKVKEEYISKWAEVCKLDIKLE